ncbi:uncharacterized protein LOC135337645 isoform X2 [Halichondria panicea]|uniref:uncharacterized protein LOC135337645 isoform X2 n=1 Tax=Halichondria panicea TaxID=6063 RepID=UPI00312B8495
MSGDTVSEDAELFISKFLERNSQQYADFVEAWNEMKFARFYCIPELCGDKVLTSSNLTLIEVIHKLLQVGVSHMTKGDGPGNSKLAGLYLCYAIYYTQPLEVKVRIRVTLDKWNTVDKMYTDFKERKMPQASYMLMTLRNDTAFLICYSSCQMFLAKTLGDKVMAHQACLPDSRSVLEGLACATSNLGDYDRMKESLSMFLPPHLLEPSILPGKIESVMKEYPSLKSHQ